MVAAGYDYSITLTSQGVVHGFGGNTYYQLGTYYENITYHTTGIGNNVSQTLPVTLSTLVNRTIVSIGAGMYHAAAVDSTGQVYTVYEKLIIFNIISGEKIH
jgi:alpha-tubulin suppressor-like RCC1 family protein